MNSENLNGKVQTFVLEGIVGRSVLQAVIADSRSIAPECALWDFKLELPVLGAGAQGDEYKCAMAELVKDAIAFFNSYGGYILAGIADSGSNRFVGVSGEFDVSDLNNKIEAATRKASTARTELLILKSMAKQSLSAFFLSPSAPPRTIQSHSQSRRRPMLAKIGHFARTIPICGLGILAYRPQTKPTTGDCC